MDCVGAESSMASPPSLWKYDVFLSFRGKDVRKGFLSHLYEALTSKGIYVFHDDKELERGDLISSGLVEAIETSRYAIVVFSENYATSRWCLEELLHITCCVETKGLVVIPVFYGVEPSETKRGSGVFERAFEEHKKKHGLEKVGKWREALAQVGSISGWDSKTWNEDSKLVEQVVRGILGKLSSDVRDLSDGLFSLSSSETDKWIGMSSHMREIEPLLSLNSKDVRMVGIWGLGGVGKSTVAGFLRERLSGKFDGSCLLENVKGEFAKQGASKLRKSILSHIFQTKDMNTWDYHDLGVMKRRLRGKKVLLVLDDVDKLEQLQELAGKPDWFGPGSRIIITSRDKRVLEQHDVEHVHEVKPLRTTQSLILFSKHAFKQARPPKDFRELSIDVVEQLRGLPLALKVIGESLYRQDRGNWEDKLLKLKNSIGASVSEVLIRSYEALDSVERKTFLYVACCFNGEYMSRVTEVLDLFVVFSGKVPLKSTPTIEVLTQKCLVSVRNRKLQVHDLLQDMARDIVCKGHESRPWKRTMLWDFEDTSNVFSEVMGSEAIEVEAIILDMADEDELRINPEIFKRMFNLKFLKISNNFSDGRGSKTLVPDGLESLPRLRYLHWEAYPLKSLPSGFRTTYLVAMHLPDSSVETLWSGTQDLRNLRRLILNRCRRLVEIPDLSKATSLETLRLCGCVSLVELPPSLGHLGKLEELSAIGCEKLEKLPDNINLESLRVLDLDSCSSLKHFPLVSDNVEELGLNKTAIEEVPPSIEQLSRLVSLRLSGCERLRNLPDTVRNLGLLAYLWLSDCPRITLFPEVGDGIKLLYLNRTAIQEVPPTIGDKSNLLLLDMSGCKKLGNLPRTLRNLTNLKFLNLRGCTNVTQLPQTAGEMRSLDLYGTSIEQYRCMSEEEVLEMHSREMASAKELLLRYIRRYKRNRASMS